MPELIYIDAVREKRAHDTSEERTVVGDTNNNAFREWSQELNRPLQGAYPAPDSHWYNEGAVAETSKEVLGQYYNFAYNYCELHTADTSIYWVVGWTATKLVQ